MIRRIITAVMTLSVAFFLSSAIVGCEENETETVQQHEQVHKSEPREVIE
ncbi:MAG: hypothetical protein JSU68_02065 [Phycisphaerales bacterium]|nr:MAG: hypothetical protein JSU68_02065 [Phycisphaerales bacterium]